MSIIQYTDENRGRIQNRDRAKQIIDFGDMRYNHNITPTDCDGEFDIEGKVFCKYEFKLRGNEMPLGQRKHFEYVIDALTSGGKKAAAFLCEHDVQNTDEDVNAAAAIVKEFYFNGKWHKDGKRTAKECTDDFLVHCDCDAWLLPF